MADETTVTTPPPVAVPAPVVPADPQGFTWGKFFSGLVNPLNFAKSFVFLLQGALIVLVAFCLVFTILKMKNIFFKPAKPAATFTVSGETTGGQIHNSNDDVKKKYGLINLW